MKRVISLSKVVNVLLLNFLIGPFFSVLILFVYLLDVVSHKLIKNPVPLVFT